MGDEQQVRFIVAGASSLHPSFIMDPENKPSEPLMKRLLMPSFTDAGANETFVPEPAALPNSQADSGCSQASTEILNNLSSTQPQLPMKRTVAVPNALPPPFFASTKPRLSTPEPRPPSPPKVSRQTMEDLGDTKEEKEAPVWEEEATPDQTAFGKQLLFQRDLDATSDVLSTASEMGTVIGEARLAEVEEELETYSEPVWEESTPRVDHTPRSMRSAPVTPRSAPYSAEKMFEWKQPSETKTPSSFLLRSPGSSAHAAAWSTKHFLSPPRFGQIARSCFSFDDTSMDHQYEYQVKSSSNNHRSLRASQSWDLSSSAKRQPSNPRRIHRPSNASSAWSSPKPCQLELSTPQRVDMEREDALDILTCLVERGVDRKQEDETKPALVEGIDPNELQSAVQALRKASQDNSDDLTHLRHMRALDQLVQTQEYANEMRRASLSASSWLKSIGRDVQSSDAAVEETAAAMDALTLNATLNTLRSDLEEKIELNARLNAELAKCRAEIGRLQSRSHSFPFTSPNRSILDESDDMEDEDSPQRTKPIADDDSAFMDDDLVVGAVTPLIREEESEVARYKAALEEANARIRKLYAEKSGDEVDTAPTVSLEDVEVDEEEDEVDENVNPSDKVSEKSTSDWDDLMPSLPPPPDHELRSPIVAAVLQEWTPDTQLHTSLVAWMEDILLRGQDPTAIPPLTLSGLDRRVRDGMLLHVLSQLGRRPDVRVVIQTRQKTTYDLAVALEPWDEQESTAVTELHSNRGRVSYDEFADGMVQSQTPTGLMQSLGGALGGLWTTQRGKGTSLLDTSELSSESSALQEEPYHRVVTAPPGRIGLTLVQTPTGVVVSAVAPDSPLEGWMFVGDTLVALDEVPVNQVKDVIGLLQERAKRPRALRVQSRHAEAATNVSVTSSTAY